MDWCFFGGGLGEGWVAANPSLALLKCPKNWIFALKVVFNFWRTYIHPCEKQVHSPGVVLIFISIWSFTLVTLGETRIEKRK